MKKLIILVVAIALVIWVISWFRAPEAVATSTARVWPGGMGTLDDVAGRSPVLKANEASAKLTALANVWPKTEAVAEFVAREIARAELIIGEPPVLPDVTAVRELLLREPIVWASHEGIDHPDVEAMRAMQLTVARMLVASAMAKARNHDASAWEDLHAAWMLSHALDAHPQMMAQTAALSTSRMFPTKMLATQVEHDRLITEQLLKTTACDVNAPANELGVDLSTVWRRAFRYRAEREATANALRIRDGKPIETRSQCSDGSWAYDGNVLRFSRDIPTAAPDRPLPLALRVKP
jgi:hypothetical protein